MSGYCSECGAPIPDGQMICSMCYGDPDYGQDGYYREYLEKMDKAETKLQSGLERLHELGKSEVLKREPKRNIGDHFQELFESSYNLIDRFGVGISDGPSFYKMLEEWSEFQKECYDGSDDALAEEAVDVIVTMINYLRAVGITGKELSKAMSAVTKKNNAKTHDTHEVKAGLIVRKE